MGILGLVANMREGAGVLAQSTPLTVLAYGCARFRAATRLACGQGFDLRCARRRYRAHGRDGKTAVS